MTLYISPHVLGSHYERVGLNLSSPTLVAERASPSQEMAKFDRIMERANREVYNPAGLNLLSPRRNAFLFVSLRLLISIKWEPRADPLFASLFTWFCSWKSSTTSERGVWPS